jgi:hypothetical protein
MKNIKHFFNKLLKEVKQGNLNRRAFLLFLKITYVKLKCFFFTGKTTDKLFGGRLNG